MTENKLLALKQAREEKISNFNVELYFNILKKITLDCYEIGEYAASMSLRPIVLGYTPAPTTIKEVKYMVSILHFSGGVCQEAYAALRNDIFSTQNIT